MFRWQSFALSLALAWFTFTAPAMAALIDYLQLNGNGTATVGPSGTLINSPVAAADRNGVAGGALSFNGTPANQSVDIGAVGSDPLDGLGTFSVSLWARWTGTQDGACCGGTFGNVLSRQANGLNSDNILGLNTNNPATGVVTLQQGAGPPIITGTTVVGSGTWRNVVITDAPGAGNARLYVDGVLQGSTTGFTNSTQLNWPISIGAWTGDGAGFSTSSIDDFGVFDTSLTANEVLSVYSGSTTAGLNFDLGQMSSLFALHNAGAGSASVGNTTWVFTNGLTGPQGQFAKPGQLFQLRLTAGGTGVTQLLTSLPEPGSAAIWALLAMTGGLVAWRNAPRRARA